MLLQASQLIGKTVGILDEHAQAGRVRGLLFDAKNGQVLALIVHSGGLFHHPHYLLPHDILDINEELILVQNIETMNHPEEVVRIETALKEKIAILGQHAQTKSGTPLGAVSDVLIDLETWTIVKYYLKRLFDERILPAEQVDSITPKAVIFSDQGIGGEIIPVAEPAETA